jgi:hypothetical protein
MINKISKEKLLTISFAALPLFVQSSITNQNKKNKMDDCGLHDARVAALPRVRSEIVPRCTYRSPCAVRKLPVMQTWSSVMRSELFR